MPFGGRERKTLLEGWQALVWSGRRCRLAISRGGLDNVSGLAMAPRRR